MTLTAFPGTDPIPTPAVIAGKGVWPAVALPDDGEERSAAATNIGMEALVERTNWIAWRLENNDGGTTAHTFVPITPNTVAAPWELINSIVATWITDKPSPTAAAAAYMEFTDIPDGVRVTSVSVWIKPSPSHSAMPASPPRIHVNAIDLSTGTVTDLDAIIVDPSANVAAFEARHAITLTADPPFKYNKAKHKLVVVFETESGTNARDALEVFGAQATWDRDE